MNTFMSTVSIGVVCIFCIKQEVLYIERFTQVLSMLENVQLFIYVIASCLKFLYIFCSFAVNEKNKNKTKSYGLVYCLFVHIQG